MARTYRREFPVADAAMQPDPVCVVPGPDQPGAPLAGDHLLEPPGHTARQGAQRVAVEVDHAVRHVEELPVPAERVPLVELLGGGDGHGANVPSRVSESPTGIVPTA